MEILDLRIRVLNHPTLDEVTRESLMAGEAFRPLAHSLQMQLLGQVASGNWLTAQVQESAVLITEDWVVSIHGKKLIHSVYAMSVLLNSISRELNAPVSVDLLAPEPRNDEPLHRVLERQPKTARIIGAIKCGATILLSAIAGAVIQWLFFGGVL